MLNRNENQARSTKHFVTAKTEPLVEAAIEESRINDRTNSLNRSNRSKNEKRLKLVTTSTTPFSDFIDEQESTESSNNQDYEPQNSGKAPIETTTPIQITEEEKIQITINQNPFSSNNNRPNKKSNEVVIEHHLNYLPKVNLNAKSLDDSKEGNHSSANARKIKNNYESNRNNHQNAKRNRLQNDVQLESKNNSKSNHLRNQIMENKPEGPVNQFEPLDSESRSGDQEDKTEDRQRTYSSNIVIDGLPGFPDPSLYMDKSESTIIPRTLIRNKTAKLELEGKNVELAADGAGFVVDSLDSNDDRESLSRESSNLRESNDNKMSDNKMANDDSQINKVPVREQIKNIKDRFTVKDPSVIWATESDESAEEQELANNKLNKPNKSIPSVFYKRNLNQHQHKQSSGNSLNQYNLRPAHLNAKSGRFPSTKHAAETVAESNQLNNKIPILVSMLHKPDNRIITPNQRTVVANSNFGYSADQQRQFNPKFILERTRSKRATEKDANLDGKVYRIFSSLNQQPTNLIKNRKSIDLDAGSSNEQNRPLKTSNYNYNNLNIYNPNDDKSKVVDRSKEDKIGNSGENDYNTERQNNLKKIKPKKKLNRPPVRQPNFLEDNPFLNLFNTLTNIGQTSLSQALGQNNNLDTSRNNVNYQRASNENESSDDDELDGNVVSTEKPKYGILGSGNIEIINGGIYKDVSKPSSKNSQPQQAFSTSDYSKDKLNSGRNNGQNNSNLNNFTPFSFNDIPLLQGFQGFDNFSKAASKLNERVI